MSGSLKDLDYLINKLRKIVPVNLQEILDSKSEIRHTHNDIYYIKDEVNSLIEDVVNDFPVIVDNNFNIDGGNATSTYILNQLISGGTA